MVSELSDRNYIEHDAFILQLQHSIHDHDEQAEEKSK